MKHFMILAGFLFGSTFCVQSQEMGYVIRVTPTLVYIDKGTDDGVGVGDKHIVIRSEGETYVPVADISVLRMFPKFSIAEILKRYDKEDIALLQWSIPSDNWFELSGKIKATSTNNYAEDEKQSPRSSVVGRRSIYFMTGMDWGRGSNLNWSQNRDLNLPAMLISSQKNNVSVVGLRLGQMITDHWRLGMTYRRGADDLQNLSIETDLQWLQKSYRNAGPYLGAGLGIAQLSIEPPSGSNASSSANKFLFNALCGVLVPGTWSLTIEFGYQKVMAWGSVINASNFRSFVGIGRDF